MDPLSDPTIRTAGQYIIILSGVVILLGGVALLTLRVFQQASHGPAAITVVILLAFLSAMAILAAVVVEGQGKEFITLAATGIGALAGAVTGLYGPRGGGPPTEPPDEGAP
jgi:hypothetical protein